MSMQKFKEFHKSVKFPFFDNHPMDCKHNFKYSAYRNLVCPNCGTVEQISYFVVTTGDNNDVYNKTLIKGTTSLVDEYVRIELIGTEFIDQWEDDGNGNYITYPYDDSEFNNNEDLIEYNENIQIDDLELSDSTNNIKRINSEINHYESFYGGFINLIDDSHYYKESD